MKNEKERRILKEQTKYPYFIQEAESLLFDSFNIHYKYTHVSVFRHYDVIKTLALSISIIVFQPLRIYDRFIDTQLYVVTKHTSRVLFAIVGIKVHV